jgi:hypothetical protein
MSLPRLSQKHNGFRGHINIFQKNIMVFHTSHNSQPGQPFLFPIKLARNLTPVLFWWSVSFSRPPPPQNNVDEQTGRLVPKKNIFSPTLFLGEGPRMESKWNRELPGQWYLKNCSSVSCREDRFSDRVLRLCFSERRLKCVAKTLCFSERRWKYVGKTLCFSERRWLLRRN